MPDERTEVDQRGDRWIVVEIEGSVLGRWAVRDRAGVLGDMIQRHYPRAVGLAKTRNRKWPWPPEEGAMSQD